jgi:hypothetical protein
VSKKLGASFFSSQLPGYRDEVNLISPTLAFQLMRKFSRFDLMGSNLGALCISGMEGEAMNILIAEPSRHIGTPTVIIIEGLEKFETSDCDQNSWCSKFLSALKKHLPQMSGIKFLITAPHEKDYIRRAFRPFGSKLMVAPNPNAS